MAIVVLPVPCAPPMSRSSPARIPPPIVLSSGVNPSGTGWYSPTRPLVTLSFRSTSTSIAERGAMLPFGPSSRHSAFGIAPVSIVTFLVVLRPVIGLWRMLAPRFVVPVTRWSRPGAGTRARVRPSRASGGRLALAGDRRELVPQPDDHPGAALEV